MKRIFVLKVTKMLFKRYKKLLYFFPEVTFLCLIEFSRNWFFSKIFFLLFLRFFRISTINSSSDCTDNYNWGQTNSQTITKLFHFQLSLSQSLGKKKVFSSVSIHFVLPLVCLSASQKRTREKHCKS